MENFQGLKFGSKVQGGGSNAYGKDDGIQVKFDTTEDENFVYATYEHIEMEVEKDTNKSSSNCAGSNGGCISSMSCKKVKTNYEIMVEKIKEKKLGVLLIGIGGNNATTMLGGICANAKKLTYLNKYEMKKANYLGSVFLSSNMRLGYDLKNKEHTYCPIHKLIEVYNPENITFGGWDINNLNLKDCLIRNKVFEHDLIEKIKDDMNYVPLKSVYFKGNFIAANQQKRVNNILTGNNKLEILEKVRDQIRNFKKTNNLDEVIVLWSGNTEKNIPHIEGVNDTYRNILLACKNNHESVSPSILYSLAAVLENSPFINSSPQNTLVNGVVQLAQQKGIFIVGNDLKTGQTKIKNFLLDFYFNTGLKPKSIVSYNHLGNNDGKNLSSDLQFYSKKISKSNLICDYVKANEHMYNNEEEEAALTNKLMEGQSNTDDYCKGDSLLSTSSDIKDLEEDYAYAEAIEKQKVNSEIVIKYVPYVGDDKKAIDEYISEIFMNGKNTISMYNVCQDSLLASPILIDLILLVELSDRVYFKMNSKSSGISPLGDLKNQTVVEPITDPINLGADYQLSHTILKTKHANFNKMECVLFLSSLFCKSPFNSNIYKTRHSFFSQFESLCNFVRIICGLPVDDHLDLPYMV
ncbi:inositol-3-phosphate synthase [Plasmodium gonderi]|uniref:inositol-3-phosphate synthase n=1 Tax=Plasmodium gonderi TaxID=77519 RepID=A0A1Y1JFZ4_PLAGO|nr:inositol-3-phosphate synthase [Plasmodium gonderi]GAW81439.1 inositol-3-phosphate synthase [Plasmodium gonderi]